MDLAIWIWGGLIIATLVTEFLTDELVSIWFSVGAFVGLILAIIGVPEWVQVVSFVVASAVLLLSTRKIVKKITKKPTVRTNMDMLIGKQSKLLTAIDEDGYGSIKFNGIVWTAVSENKDQIAENIKVEVVGIKGNKLVVKLVKEKEE